MKQYLDIMQQILDTGEKRIDRTGVGTLAIYGTMARYDLRTKFPAMTTKRLAWKAVVSELLWFLEGSNDERRLCEILHGTRDAEKTTVWSDNAYADYWTPKAAFPGDVGRNYGVQWRSWLNSSGIKVDQIAEVIELIKKDPVGRRHIVSAWNPGELKDTALPPCHIMFQFYVSNNGELSCLMYQRSNDWFLGDPFNIASYSLLTHMIAQVCGLKVGEFIHCTGDTHLYLNHLDQAREQLSREPRELPTLWINSEVTDINKFTMDDFRLDGYDPHPAIKAPMAK